MLYNYIFKSFENIIIYIFFTISANFEIFNNDIQINKYICGIYSAKLYMKKYMLIQCHYLFYLSFLILN